MCAFLFVGFFFYQHHPKEGRIRQKHPREESSINAKKEVEKAPHECEERERHTSPKKGGRSFLWVVSFSPAPSGRCCFFHPPWSVVSHTSSLSDVAAFPPRSFGCRCRSPLFFWVALISFLGWCCLLFPLPFQGKARQGKVRFALLLVR